MSLLICTPIHGAGVTKFWLSILKLQETLIYSDFDHAFLILENESLIQRARNNSVTTFLDTEYDRFLFIDSDIEFEPEDVLKLWNADKDIVCGAYSMKREDCPTSAWVDGSLVDLEKLDGLTKIDFCGTGFVMYKRKVFEEMKSHYPERIHSEGKPGENVLSHRVSFAYFDPRVEDGVYYSEDYAQCLDWRAMGGEIWIDPTIHLTHWGSKGYSQ